ncbi:hypothetical protein DNTS_016575 [Danionella cerebrum]|uniref:BAR domain-containing protein n=1 Tax=Danionella cerebrum TaxID=2873325 RepID=A0A553P0X0_9TELE|nr:hypothetical protein DNTS_016575 [Danionella translucida]
MQMCHDGGRPRHLMANIDEVETEVVEIEAKLDKCEELPNSCGEKGKRFKETLQEKRQSRNHAVVTFYVYMQRQHLVEIQHESRVEMLVKLCGGMIEAGKAYVTANKLFINGIRDLSQHCKKDQMISSSPQLIAEKTSENKQNSL